MTVDLRALRPEDDRQGFRSGDEALDLFFHRYAGQNQFRHHIGVTYVAASGQRILGFVTVSPGQLEGPVLPSGRRMPPYPLPILRLARLAVDQASHGQGIGKLLLRHVLELAERMREEFGCVGVLVDAKPTATGFYSRYGFEEVEADEGASQQRPAPVLMFLPLASVPPRPA